MTNKMIPPEWVKHKSSSRETQNIYYFNTLTKEAYWEDHIKFGENGEVTISENAKRNAMGVDKDKNVNQQSMEDVDDELDDDVIAYLNSIKSQNAVQHKQTQNLNNGLKRKHEGNVSQYHNKSSRQNCVDSVESKNCITEPTCSRQDSGIPYKIKKISDQNHQGIQKLMGTERKPETSSSTNYSQKHLKIGRTNTPMQDRYNKQKEELLNKQEKSTDSGILKSLSKEDQTPKQYTNGICKRKEGRNAEPRKFLHRTPIQDKYNKANSLLLKKQEEIADATQSGNTSTILKRNNSQGVEASQNGNNSKMFRRNNYQGYPEKQNVPSENPNRKRITFGSAARPGVSSRESSSPDAGLPSWIPYASTSQATSGSPSGRQKSNGRLSSSPDSPVHKQQVLGRKNCNGRLTSSPDSPVHKQVFDLRIKLQQKKSRVTSPNLQSDVALPMDWETSYPVAQVSQEVVNSESPPSQERRSQYSNIYLVCDTSALIKDYGFVEECFIKGSYLGLPLTVAIPYVVFYELDHLKSNNEVGYQAREMSRIIKSHNSSKHLYLQEADKNRVAVGSLELKVNDDLVLNCCLQMREKCGNNDLAILLTNDVNLANKATSCKLQSYNLNEFKRWARGLRERKTFPLSQTLKQVSSTKMIVDEEISEEGIEKRDLRTTEHTTENKTKLLNGTVNNNIQNLGRERSIKDSTPSSSRNIPYSQLRNVIESHLDELKSDFQMFLHNVLEEAYEKEYKNLKNFATRIKATWTVVDYLYEVSTRWFLLSNSNFSASPSEQQILDQLITGFKKHKSGQEEIKVDDVDNLFSLCASLTDIIAKYSQENAISFLDILNKSKDDWKDAISNLSPGRIGVEDVNPVDVALQHIHQCSYTDYEKLKNRLDNNECDTETRKQLKVFYGRIADVEYVMKKIFQQKPNALAIMDEYILQLHRTITSFSDVEEHPIGFEIVPENIVELFQDKAYRNNAKQLIEKFEQLKTLIDDLICTIE